MGVSLGIQKLSQSYNLTELGIYWIIHTVGPIFRNNGSEEKYLRRSYNSALNVAANYAHIYLEQSMQVINE